jgi:hypothetical protein
LRNVEGFNGVASLYSIVKVDPDDHYHVGYVVVSSIPGETLVLKANSKGHVTDWKPLEGSTRLPISGKEAVSDYLEWLGSGQTDDDDEDEW